MRYLFVTGLPRSGTTAAARLLGWHPRCVMAYETHLVLDMLQAFSPSCGSGPGHHLETYWHGETSEVYQWGSQHMAEVLTDHRPEVGDPAARLARAAVDGIAEVLLRVPEVRGLR